MTVNGTVTQRGSATQLGSRSFNILKEVTSDPDLEDMSTFRHKMFCARMEIAEVGNEFTTRMLLNPDPPTITPKKKFCFVVQSVAELGFVGRGGLRADVYARAEEWGLSLCPSLIIRQFRLEYSEQPMGEALHVAMEPIVVPTGRKLIFSLDHHYQGLLLTARDGYPEDVLPPDTLLLFCV